MMKILRRKSDNVVVMAHPGLAWTDGILAIGGVRAPNIRETDHEICAVSSIPDDFQGGHYTYSEAGGWVRTAAGEEAAAEVEAARLPDRLKDLAALRYEKETAGIIVNGAKVRTDRESQATVTGMYNAVQIDPTRVIRFKGANGWVTLDAAAVAVVAGAVADHVQACFSRESELADALGEDINTDITTGWPE